MILSHIHSPIDVQNLSPKEIPLLAREIRKTIIETVGKNGGHLASNLGVVELTIALHRVFHSPEDAIIFDVSHQSYTHKLLTGRYERFSTLRQAHGISGFTRKEESVHDFFTVGHASTSISMALGLLAAKEMQGQNGKAIAVIGDGALTGGMSFEALSHAGQLQKNLIVVLNDNQMSIEKNTGSLSRYLSKMTMSARYQSFRYKVDRLIDRIPVFNKWLAAFAFRFKRAVKGLFFSNNLFSDLGFEYVGPLNGHDEKNLEFIFRRAKNVSRPVVIHVVTKKGKGYAPAEKNPEDFHGVGAFLQKSAREKKITFTDAFSVALLNEAEKNENIVAVTAAMAKGCGLHTFSEKYPSRFFDTGIAEEHAASFCAASACGNLLPVFCVYATFLQRAIDQVIHDVALQNAHVVFALDRAGPVPFDGETHQGLFDIALLLPIPNLTILSPATKSDMRFCLSYALTAKKPAVLRYPKKECPCDGGDEKKFSKPTKEGVGVFVSANETANAQNKAERKSEILFVCTGGMYGDVKSACAVLAKRNIFCDIYTLRFIKPLDEKYFLLLAKKYKGIVFVEDGVESGGISEKLLLFLYKNKMANASVKAFPNKFYTHGNREWILEQANMQISDIVKAAAALLKAKKQKR